ncbi:hypothetical protein ABKN59_004057 [Abortiporus biennis]
MILQYLEKGTEEKFYLLVHNGTDELMAKSVSITMGNDLVYPQHQYFVRRKAVMLPKRVVNEAANDNFWPFRRGFHHTMRTYRNSTLIPSNPVSSFVLV